MEDKALMKAGTSLARVQAAMEASMSLEQTLKAALAIAEQRLPPEAEAALYAAQRLKPMQARLFELRFKADGTPIKGLSYAAVALEKKAPPRRGPSALQRLRKRFGPQLSAMDSILANKMDAAIIAITEGVHKKSMGEYPPFLCVPEEGECWIYRHYPNVERAPRGPDVHYLERYHCAWIDMPVDAYFLAHPHEAEDIVYAAQREIVKGDIEMARSLAKLQDDFSDLPEITQQLCNLFLASPTDTGHEGSVKVMARMVEAKWKLIDNFPEYAQHLIELGVIRQPYTVAPGGIPDPYDPYVLFLGPDMDPEVLKVARTGALARPEKARIFAHTEVGQLLGDVLKANPSGAGKDPGVEQISEVRARLEKRFPQWVEAFDSYVASNYRLRKASLPGR